MKANAMKRFLAAAVAMCMVLLWLPQGALSVSTSKIDVWDFGAEQLDSGIYDNMLDENEINSWFPGIEPGTSGTPLLGFTSSDGQLMFEANGKTNNRLRTTNENLCRYDSKSLEDANGNVYTGYIYSNSSSTDKVYVGLQVTAGDKVTLVVGSNGGDSLINFEAPSGEKATGQFLSSGAKAQLLTFYPAETGMYKIYSSTEKLVLARIYRETPTSVSVTGNVDAPAELSGYSVVFTNTASGAVSKAAVENGAYSLSLPDGYSYEVSLENANGYIILGNKTLTIEKGAASASLDLRVLAVELVSVSGSITGLDEAALGKLKLSLQAEAVYQPEIVISGTSYTVQVEAGQTYTVVAEGINDYALTSAATVTYTADTAADITFEKKPVHNVTIVPEGATAADLAGATFTFINLNEEGYVYSFTGTEGIALRDGVYSVVVSNSGSFVQQLTSNLKIQGADVSKTIKFASEVTVWDFTESDFTGGGYTGGAGTYKGLSWTNGKSHNGVYLYSGTGSVTVPVSGPCQIQVSACYQYSFYFESESEASVNVKTGSTGQIDVFTYNYTGGAGTVTITVLGTSYLCKIELVQSVPYAETVTVGASGCDYATIGDALNAIAAMPRPNGERVTVLIQPGNYEEMLVVNVPNVTLKNASDAPSIALTDKGVGIAENAVRITWYYGHGYNYYSMGTDYKYDPTVLEVNKENGYASTVNPGAGTGTYWNATVVVLADGFRAEGIIFENSFNQYVSEKAALDVLVAKENEAKEGTTPRAQLAAGSTAVQNKAYVERASALAIGNNCTEVYFENCKFVGRQDTLYGGKGSVVAFYDCAIYGGTDYIFGGMTAVFAKCDLVFNTSEDKNDVGYITAAQQDSGRGYLMYNCTVTSTTPGVDTASEYPSKPGYFGRPWTAKTSEVIFYYTVIEATDAHWYSLSPSLIHAEGWNSSLGGESNISGEFGTYEWAADVDNSANRASWAQVFTDEKCADGTPMTIANFLGDWDAFAGKDLTVELPSGKVDNSPTEEEEPSDEQTYEHSFDSLVDVKLEGENETKDKAAIPAGTTYADGFFTVVGTVTQRYSSSKGGVYCVELGKNGTGAFEFTVSNTASVTIAVSSTGGSNTSAIAIIDAEGNVVANVEGLSEVKGTSTTILTYVDLPAGTYQIVSPVNEELNRGVRLMTIDVVETPPEPETTEHTFDSLVDVKLEGENETKDKAAIPAGTTYADGFFTVVGTVTQRFQESKGGVYAVEIAKNLTGAIAFTTTGVAKVVITVSSTGGSNTSAVALVDAQGNAVANDEGLTEVTGTAATTLTYTDLPAGTYQIASPVNEELNRGFRLMTIDVDEAVEGESEPDPDPKPEEPTELTAHSFSSLVDVALEGDNATKDKAAVLAGTTYSDGFFKVFGSVTQRYDAEKGGVYAVELSKNAGGGFEFVIPEGALADIVITVSSTGGSNTSAIAIVAADGTVLANVEGLSEVTGTAATTLTYEGVPAGTYKIVSPQSDYGRGTRLMTIDVAPHVDKNPESGDAIGLIAVLLVASGAGLAILPRKKEN